MKSLLYLLFAGMLTGILLFGSCEKVVYPPPPEIELPDTVSYSLDIQPIWDNQCVNCHDGGRDPDLRPDNSYASLMGGGYINTDEPEESELMKKLDSSPHDSRATEAEKQLILAWIDEGAKNN
ncbi:MAG: hypothetical protein KAI95_13485 [Bacteroidales bacterium]|nr:hypothetical protein [Bacteroidales bacterium]